MCRTSTASLIRARCRLALLALALGSPLTARAADFTVRVDAREAARGILHVTQTFPAGAPVGGARAGGTRRGGHPPRSGGSGSGPGSGTMVLSYPRWIPGEHGPTGPGVDVAGFVPRAGGRALPWRRDPADMTTIRVEVPAGTRQLEVAFDFLLDSSTQGFTSAACGTPNLLVLSWNQVAFYPWGRRADSLSVSASLVLPVGWKHASALEESGAADGAVTFAPCTFTTLVDSPVLAGRHFRTVDLAPGADPPVRLRMACDSPEGLGIPDDQVTALRNLVREARALFGGEHFRHYDFLVSLSEHIAHFGLEHHQSSDNRGRERWWLEGALRLDHSNLLAHEYVHSWNGKFRRPAGLATGDHFTRMDGELLWIYEGLTQYLGFVLSARSGIRTSDEARDALARAAARLEANRGRSWRPLVDTGTHAQELYGARDAWEHWRRGTDFYDEGLLVWLEADVTIRSLTQGRRSLDDFCRVFHGGPNRGPEVKPYELAEVLATLGSVAPHDWARFFRERVYEVRPHAPLGGITAGGWALAWADSLGPLQAAEETADEKVVERYSLGVTLDKDGKVKDLVPGSPADAAGIAPEMKLVAVNGRRYTKDVLRDAIGASKGSGTLELLCENKGFFRSYKLAYRSGRRHPVLTREGAERDVLSEILSARAR